MLNSKFQHFMDSHLAHETKCTPRPPRTGLEWYFVVTIRHISTVVTTATTATATVSAAMIAAGTTAIIATATVATTIVAGAIATARRIVRACIISSAAKKPDGVSHDFRAVSISTVPILPFAGLNPTLHKQLFAFSAIASDILSLAAKDNHGVPLRVIRPVSFPIFSAVGRRDPKRCNGRAAACGTNLWILAQVTNENGFIDCH